VRIGIFISGRQPEEGGGYTITYEIFNQLINKIRNKKKFIFILLNDKNNYFKKKLISSNLEFKDFNEIKLKTNIKNFLFSYIPFFLKFYRFLGRDKFFNLQNKENIKLVWFISAEYHYPLFNKYYATVWDLMHKTHPNFKEVGSFFTRIYRDIVISSFLKSAARIITGTNYLKKILVNSYNLNNIKIILASHPTPNFFIKKKKLLSKKNITNFFLYPANFWEHKNHINLIKGFNSFNIKHDLKYDLIFVGSVKDKRYYNKIVDLIKNIESYKKIKIFNFVSINRLLDLYDTCKALVYPSYCGPENLPPLEAFARNKPVICSLYEGAKEQLKDYPIYFDPKDLLSIERALELFTLTNSKKKYKEFAIQKNINKYLDLILKNIYNTKL
jgi:glycosyltransferase involved in cell wall biosynthesis